MFAPLGAANLQHITNTIYKCVKFNKQAQSYQSCGQWEMVKQRCGSIVWVANKV